MIYVFFVVAECASLAKNRFSCNTWWVVLFWKNYCTLPICLSHLVTRCHDPPPLSSTNLCPLPSHTRECVQNNQGKQLHVAPVHHRLSAPLPLHIAMLANYWGYPKNWSPYACFEIMKKREETKQDHHWSQVVSAGKKFGTFNPFDELNKKHKKPWADSRPLEPYGPVLASIKVIEPPRFIWLIHQIWVHHKSKQTHIAKSYCQIKTPSVKKTPFHHKHLFFFKIRTPTISNHHTTVLRLRLTLPDFSSPPHV